MQFTLFASIVVFVGSYFPLSLILLAQDYRYDLFLAPICWPFTDADCAIPLQNGLFPLVIFGVCLVCFLLSLGVLATVRPKMPADIKEAKYIPAELMSYTLPYVVSFMSLNYQDTGKFIGLLIFLGWMFLILYRSGQLVMNPLLIVFGWRLYEVRYSFPGAEGEHFGRVLSKVPLEPGKRYNQAVVQDVMVIKSGSNDGGD
ncbi:MAG: hypothetical protein H6873_01155 [Hyphomicrobiaceae bacterium]|nr:hypothetical protein [Hyphomicrobiaceae bacterium]